MGLKDEIKEYMQPDGLVSPDKNPGIDSTGNGILYSSLYMMLLYKLNLFTIEDVAWYVEAVFPCQKELGLYQRSKTKEDYCAHDDYIGIAIVSYYYYPLRLLAKDILNYGKKYWWYFGGWIFSFSFLMKPQDIAFFYYCAKEKPPSWLDKFYWIYNYLINFRKTTILGYLLYSAKARLAGQFDEEMKNALAGELGMDHPITKYWPTDSSVKNMARKTADAV